MDDDKLLEKFKLDLARFSADYLEFLVIVKRKDGNLNWKSTDKTWAYGAAMRYAKCFEAADWKEEHDHIDENKKQD